MSLTARVRTSLIASASAVVVASLVGAGTGPAGAAPAGQRASAPAQAAPGLAPTAGSVTPRPLPESQAPADSPRELVLEQQRAATRTALAGTIPQRLQAAGADAALGSRVSAVVLDADTGAVIYSRNPTLALMPASNEKLGTALTALARLGVSKTFRTEVRSSSTFGTLYLRGGGDPALTAAQVRTMAGTVKAALTKAGKTSVIVRVDDDLFPAPTNATGWKTSYLPGDVAPVRPLVVDGRNLNDTALDAGALFRNELVRLGITVSSLARGAEPAGTVAVASVTSPPLSTLVARMLNVSDNDYAEFFHRHSSLAAGKGATWTAANANTVATLKARGINTSGQLVFDGSGLSRSDRSSASNVTSLLLHVTRSGGMSAVFYGANALPTAGVSGTLATRFAQPDTLCARGKVRAKTGTLSDVTALSGTAYGVDGKRRIFSIVENGAADTSAARFALERFATAATGCNPA